MEIRITSEWTAAAKRMLAEVESMDIIPPKNGKEYSRQRQRFITGESSSVLLSERQVNLATLTANTDMELWKVYIKAGYAYESYFNEAGNVKRTKAHLTANCRHKMVPTVTAFSNYLKYGAAEELKIDATWVLNESVSLFEECKRTKNYTQAIRLLDTISTHVDVDAKVSNRLVVENAIDYASILSEADTRSVIEHDAPVAIELSPLTSEYTVDAVADNNASH